MGEVSLSQVCGNVATFTMHTTNTTNTMQLPPKTPQILLVTSHHKCFMHQIMHMSPACPRGRPPGLPGRYVGEYRGIECFGFTFSPWIGGTSGDCFRMNELGGRNSQHCWIMDSNHRDNSHEHFLLRKIWLGDFLSQNFSHLWGKSSSFLLCIRGLCKHSNGCATKIPLTPRTSVLTQHFHVKHRWHYAVLYFWFWF